MSGRPSRRGLLSSVGAVFAASFAGCLDSSEREEIDVTVSNASTVPVDYDVTIEEVEKTGAIEASGSDQYEDELPRPDSTTRFDVVGSFEIDVRGSQNETEPRAGSETSGSANESSDGQPGGGRFGATIEVTADVTKITVIFTGDQMNVNTVTAEAG
ncbi:hypothetical protein GRX03_10945 [Halovenus sp. WSH3]|uniref:Uncharacterized protein n=1 Tax=Halovenus carboxidivorans TaxID=2692199 RepID=A0A6B0T968_9EURY|nr:hypothetical protein [Halovenus carboxidivorans]MXR52113.1 hypothetical protein [Halovenus carboxidivorans]